MKTIFPEFIKKVTGLLLQSREQLSKKIKTVFTSVIDIIAT